MENKNLNHSLAKTIDFLAFALVVFLGFSSIYNLPKNFLIFVGIYCITLGLMIADLAVQERKKKWYPIAALFAMTGILVLTIYYHHS